MINAKREAAEKKIIKTFDKEPDLQILNGRYGPYIAYQKRIIRFLKRRTERFKSGNLL